jgi:hypothetical protein
VRYKKIGKNSHNTRVLAIFARSQKILARTDYALSDIAECIDRFHPAKRISAIHLYIVLTSYF